jgi:hypothetical protein
VLSPFRSSSDFFRLFTCEARDVRAYHEKLNREERVATGDDYDAVISILGLAGGMTQSLRAATLRPGARIVSIAGECDDGDDGLRETGPNAIGTVVAVYPGQEERYGFGFENGTSVLLTIDELADPEQYELLD